MFFLFFSYRNSSKQYIFTSASKNRNWPNINGDDLWNYRNLLLWCPWGFLDVPFIPMIFLYFWPIFDEFFDEYRKVLSSKPVCYSILEHFGQRWQYISIKFPLLKPSENLEMCYWPRQATARDFIVQKFHTFFKFKIAIFKTNCPQFLVSD